MSYVEVSYAISAIIRATDINEPAIQSRIEMQYLATCVFFVCKPENLCFVPATLRDFGITIDEFRDRLALARNLLGGAPPGRRGGGGGAGPSGGKRARRPSRRRRSERAHFSEIPAGVSPHGAL